MFELAVDQADGLRRLFTPREPSVIPLACCAPAPACRGVAAAMAEWLAGTGFSPRLFDRLDLPSDLGEVQTHAPVDRLLLLDQPVRLARWLQGRQASMLLLLSHHREELPSQYATIKSVVTKHGLHQFATCYVDAPSAGHAAEAHYRLASCARRFLHVEVEPLVRGAHGEAALREASPARLQRFAIAIRGLSPSDLLMPAGGAGLAH